MSEPAASSTQSQTAPTTPFEAIRREDPTTGQEYWSARDLARVLGYRRWEVFPNVIKKAEQACGNSHQPVSDHFRHLSKLITAGKGAKRQIEDVHLSRYACYLVVQNADPSKEIVALGQTYFAVQTRRQEVADTARLEDLDEDTKRLYYHQVMTSYDKQLAATVEQAGIVKPADFAVFQDHGFMGLYGGLKASDLQARKKLDAQEPLIDYMGSEELAANIFRTSQINAKLRRDEVTDRQIANQTHQQIGQEVRYTIERIGGTMPEELPTPGQSIRQLQQKQADLKKLPTPAQEPPPKPKSRPRPKKTSASDG